MPAPTPLPEALRHRPFRLDELPAHGISRRIVDGHRYRRLFRGVYAAADLPQTHDLRVRAAGLLAPTGAVASHHTAARLRDLPVPEDELVHLSSPGAGRGSRVRGLVVHRIGQGSPVRIRGLPVTSALQTFQDLGSQLGLVDLVILADAMVRWGYADLTDLTATARTTTGRGTRNLCRAASLCRPRVDSPMETRSRLLVVVAGLPCPVTGYEIIGPDGGWLATVDLAYPKAKIAIEYDGDLHRTSRRKWRSDVATRELVRRAGWEIIILTADDIDRRPAYTLARIHDSLLDRGQPGVPATLDPRWEAWFPPRRWGSASPRGR